MVVRLIGPVVAIALLTGCHLVSALTYDPGRPTTPPASVTFYASIAPTPSPSQPPAP